MCLANELTVNSSKGRNVRTSSGHNITIINNGVRWHAIEYKYYCRRKECEMEWKWYERVYIHPVMDIQKYNSSVKGYLLVSRVRCLFAPETIVVLWACASARLTFNGSRC